MDVSAAGFLACLLVVAFGAFVQGSVGFGINLLAAPVIALAAPEAVPGSVVLISLPMTVLMAFREHEHADRRGVAWFSVGRIPGVGIGVAVLGAVSSTTLTVLVGVAIVAAVAATTLHPNLRPTPRTTTVAGVAAGVTGTIAAVDGPPLALVYQHSSVEVVRPTFAMCFVIGTLMTTIALVLAGDLTGDQVLFTLALMPGLLAGLAASRLLAPRLAGRNLRPAVLTFAALAGFAAILRGVL